MSDEHMAMAREVTRDWTPQTTLADSRRDIANALAAAEERGRRSTEMERDELRACLDLARSFVSLQADRRPSEYNQELLTRINAALAPRVPHASEGPPCAGCGHPKWQHQYGSREHAFCCQPLDELQRDYCRCKNYLAPRDAGPASVCLNCGKVDGHWPKCPSYQAPRDSAPDAEKLMRDLRDSATVSTRPPPTRDSGKEG